VSLSHERLFDVWAGLKDYVDMFKKMVVVRTLLEGRARKWAEMGKPWIRGLARGREYSDFLQAGVNTTSVMKDYLKASFILRWCIRGPVGAIVALAFVTVWVLMNGYSLHQAKLRVQSFVVSIHIDHEVVHIPGGTFQQGDAHSICDGGCSSSGQPLHHVRIKSFAMGKHEVMFEEYDRFVLDKGKPLPADPGWGRGDNPVVNVSWDDAKAYAKWLSAKTGKNYRLPSESEWEYAARGGGADEIWAGTSEQDQLNEFAVYSKNSHGRTAVVNGRKHNRFGLHDMSGNVWEWVEDCWHDSYLSAPKDGLVWLEEGDGSCGQRVIRGGSWDNKPDRLRVSLRNWSGVFNQSNSLGFRLVLDLEE